MNNKYAPIVVFTYNRLEHTKQCIESLEKNILAKESEIFIFSDGPKNEENIKKVDDVRNYIKNIEKGSFKNITIYESTNNKGLANSVISGVSKIIDLYGKVIVVEDDLILSPYFLNYMNNSLDYYRDHNSIWSISGFNIPIRIQKKYNKDVYLSYRASSWGWATWKDRWETIDWDVVDYESFKNSYIKRRKFNRGGKDLSRMLDAQMQGKINSWAIRWCYNQSKQNKYTVYPCKSYVKNCGNDGTGTNCGNIDIYKDVRINNEKINLEYVEPNRKILKKFRNHYAIGKKEMIKEYLIRFKLYEER